VAVFEGTKKVLCLYILQAQYYVLHQIAAFCCSVLFSNCW